VYKTAVVGCGRIGTLFDFDKKNKIIRSHCGAYTNHHNTILTSVCDIDLKKAKKAKEQWNIDSYYNDHNEMLDREDIDILSICTHPDSHEEIVNDAVNSGVKAIFCEKPISHNMDSALKIFELCKSNNIKLAINHYRRWDPYFVNLKNEIINMKFGKLQHINFYYTRGIANTGSHLFDLLRYLFGEIISINAISSIEEIIGDPTISCTLEMENSLLCNLIGLDGRYYRIFDLEIFGSKSKISIDTSKRAKLFSSTPSKRSSEFNELYEITDDKKTIENSETIISSVTNIIECIEGRNEINCSGIDGYKSLELILAAVLSNKMNKKITLPLEKKHFTFSIQ
jgi:predicted dehydrogenase